MIVKRTWLTAMGEFSLVREGWFLFGIIPIYVRDLTVRPDPKQAEHHGRYH